MTVTRLTPKEYAVSRWSGGETTQLMIWPRDAVYGERTFLWRLSSATVEQEKSVFTALPDYDRLIATLEGTVTLSHDGGKPLTLAPFQVHAFDGGCQTVSSGRCRDFNLMLRKGKAAGSLTAVTAGAFPLTEADRVVLLYCAQGSCTVDTGDRVCVLWPEESLLLEAPGVRTLTLRGDGRVMLARMGQVR